MLAAGIVNRPSTQKRIIEIIEIYEIDMAGLGKLLT